MSFSAVSSELFYYSVEWLILDEADKLFEEGKDGFREQVSQSTIFILLLSQ